MEERTPPTAEVAGLESVRTFLIADVRDYTRFTLEHGDEAAAGLTARFAEIVGEVVGPYGGAVVELRGDEALSVFTSPRSALRAAVALQTRLGEAASPELPLKVGVGIDAGEAVRVGDGFRGAALNLAARLCAAARAGEVLASEGVMHLARRVEGVSYVSRDPVQAKGFADPIRVVQVTAEVTAVPAPETVDAAGDNQTLPTGGFLGSLPAGTLAGREAEVQRLRQSVAAVESGEGRLILLAGEPGIGKTRLAQELTADVYSRGFLVAAGRCYEPQASVAYYPFLEALAALFVAAPAALRRDAARRWPYLGQLLPEHIPTNPVASSNPDEQQRLFRTITDFVAAVADETPVALLLDDLHWADQSSLDLLQYLARHTRTAPVLILGTYRDVEVNRRHPLGRAVRDLHREDLAEEIPVRRLDQRDTAKLMAGVLREAEISGEFAALIYRQTEGNPFFTQEVLRALVERGDVYRQGDRWERRAVAEIEVPRSVRDAVGERLARLPEESQVLLHEAAVLGQTFQFDDLLALSGRSEEEVESALEDGIAAALVQAGEKDTYAFSHALVQSVLYTESGPRRRRRLHRRAGEALDNLPERKRAGRAAELAWHFLQADEPDRALPYAIQAGDAAAAVVAFADAAHQYRIALELMTDAVDSSREAEVLGKLGRVLSLHGLHDEGLEALEGAARLFRAAGDTESESRLAYPLALAYRGIGRSSAGAEVMLDLLHRSEPSARSATLADLYRSLEFLYFGAGRYQEGLAAAERASAHARESGDELAMLIAQVSLGTELTMCGSLDEGNALLEDAADRGRQLGTVDVSVGRALINLGNNYMMQGRLDDAVNVLEEALSFSERTGSTQGVVMTLQNLSTLEATRGNLSYACFLGERSVVAAEGLTGTWWLSYALLAVGEVLLMEGRWQDAIDVLRRAVEPAARAGDIQVLRSGCSSIADALFHLARAEEALALLEPLADGDRLDELYMPGVWSRIGDAHLALGDLRAARRTYDEVLVGASLPPDIRIRALLGRSAVESAEERWDEALRDADAALALARESGHIHLEASVLHCRGVTRRGMGDPEGAADDLKRSCDLFHRMGAPAYADEVAASLATVDDQA